MPNLAKMKALLENAKAAYKAQFTGGFYHGSPSPNIKAFDSLKNTDPMKLETPGVTFATRDPDFAESFLPGSERGGYKAGATMYPVSINLGKHWHPNQPESQQVVEDYLKKMYPHEANPQDLVDIKKDMLKAKWEDIENPNFLQHLRDTGHDTFHVMEGGIPNVGVFEPQNIRGKFAAFNPEDAASPEIMKAAGGSVQHFQVGGKVIGGLTELMQLIKQQGGTNAAKRLERAADLVPNLENKFQPQALKNTFAGDNASAVMVMKPGDFQKYATPLPEGHKTWDQFKIEDQDRRGNYQDYLDYLGRVSNESGFSSVPYLQLDRKAGSFFPEITGHEGRNRSEALDKLGDQSSLVQMIPRAGLRESFPRRSNEEYLNMLHSEIGSKPMVTVQPDWDPDSEKWIRRGLRDLPEMFAGGGKIGILESLAKNTISLAEREANKAKFLEGTKVVDYNGKPITMYHHTTDFQGDAFDPKLAQQKDQGYHGQGMYFGTDDYLKRSAFGKYSSGNVYGEEGFTEGSQVMPVNLSIKNPKYIDVTEQSLHGMPIERLKEMGHDGVIVTRDDSFQNVMGRTIPRQKVYNAVAFEPTQVKSAIGNEGTFDPTDPRLHKAAGGKIEALKQLAHAVTVPFTHFSPQEALTTLDPRKYGTGMKGAEAARLSTATDIAPRSYFYHGENIVPESGVGGNKYTGVSQNSYPISKDPAGFYDQARTNDPYLMEMGIRQHSPEHTINNMERMIKDAGYSGYHTDTGTGVLFNDTPVIKAQ